VYFTADDGINGKELWVTDGTAAGTILFKNLNTHTLAGSYPHSFTQHGQKFFFIADTGPINNENFQLFVSDGTAAGTVSIAPPAAVANPFNSFLFPFYLTSTPAGLYFKSGFEGDFELWRYYSPQQSSDVDAPQQKVFTCYPNPYRDALTCFSDSETHIQLYTIEGKLLKEYKLQKGEQTIPLSGVQQPLLLQSPGKSMLLFPDGNR
jgi:ELWxxDGT repeat protein